MSNDGNFIHPGLFPKQFPRTVVSELLIEETTSGDHFGPE